jgi:hypothetical protein
MLMKLGEVEPYPLQKELLEACLSKSSLPAERLATAS